MRFDNQFTSREIQTLEAVFMELERLGVPAHLHDGDGAGAGELSQHHNRVGIAETMI